MRSIRCVYIPWARCRACGQAEGGQTADNREGRAGDQPAAAQVAADAAHQRQFCERSGSVCVPDVCAGTSRARALEKFHAKMKKAYAKIGLTYKYIAVTEEHDMDGEPVRLHHHLILSGAHGVQLAEVVRDCWASGLADVRTLREGAELRGHRNLSAQRGQPQGQGRPPVLHRNLTPPAEPVRLRLGEEEEAEVPPGVKVIEHVQNANEFGRYEVMVGRIYNQAAFDAWWQYSGARLLPIRGNACAGDGKEKPLRYRRPGPPDSLVGGLTNFPCGLSERFGQMNTDCNHITVCTLSKDGARGSA